MSETTELATNTENNGTSALVAATVIGGIVVGGVGAIVLTYGKIKEWGGKRKAERKQKKQQPVVVVETNTPTEK